MSTLPKLSPVSSGLGVGAVVLTAALSGFPLWKSATLSPDSIQRRVYWTGTVIAVVLLFLSALPDWRSAVFVSAITAVVMVTIALRWTKHLKIGGRTYGTRRNRTPDRPPALTRDSDDV